MTVMVVGGGVGDGCGGSDGGYGEGVLASQQLRRQIIALSTPGLCNVR